ncbi:hypothetical protein BU26DRAFT_513523 [Trematosphaeria pertusa]|uniref:Uncharacterized protein n=1 Tax=Trematosphaeria pertusa TaxID=390896 RepID=A0A6A6J318_9PLEO|nr:uncharacterized protein BU26DRAFT_513523 [Trematosphaeria pertusa]KAF2256737.1 hypothetical protein BU26DRAFT_513523 [Trematosphaeria pertusa]
MASPATDFVSLRLNPSPTATTPYREARRRGNALLYLPREIRDKIYEWCSVGMTALLRVNEKGRPTVGPTELMLASKLLYREAEPSVLRSLVFAIGDTSNLAQVVLWLEAKKSFNAFHCVRAVMFDDFDTFRKVPSEQVRTWWQDRINAHNTKSVEVHDKVLPEPQFVPAAIGFLSRCNKLRSMVVDLPLREFALYTPGMLTVFDNMLLATTALYDLATLSSISTLRRLCIKLMYCNARHQSVLDDLTASELEELFTARHHPEMPRLKDAWGLKSWLAELFRRKQMDVEIFCEYNTGGRYSSPVDDEEIE